MSLHEDNYNSNIEEGRFHSLKKLTPKGLMLSGLVGIFVFLVLLGIYFIFLNDNELKEGYKETVGVVVGNEYHLGGSQETYSPIVEYIVGDESFIITAGWSCSPPTLLGTELIVHYNEENPQDAKVQESMMFNILFFIVMGIFGVVGVSLVVLGIIKKLKN